MRPLRRALAAAFLAAQAALAVAAPRPAAPSASPDEPRLQLQRRLLILHAAELPPDAALELAGHLPGEVDAFLRARPANAPDLSLVSARVKAEAQAVRSAAAGALPMEATVQALRQDLSQLLGAGSPTGVAATRPTDLEPSAAAQRPVVRVDAAASLGAGARVLACDRAFDGAGCALAAAPAAGVRRDMVADAGPGPASIGAGANPKLDQSSVPGPVAAQPAANAKEQPSAIASVTAGVWDAVKEEFGTLEGAAKAVANLLIGAMLSFLSGGIWTILKIAAALAGIAGLGALVAGIWAAWKQVQATKENTPEHTAALRALGKAGGALLIAAALTIVGMGGPRRSAEAARGGIEAALAKAGLTLKTKPLNRDYVGEDQGSQAFWGSKVQYLGAQARQRFRLTVKDGKLFDAEGKLFDTASGRTAHGSQKSAIFVMDSRGNIYASLEHRIGEFHHSSFLAGGRVAAAGELVVENGVLKNVNNQSGHYTPPAAMLDQFMAQLRKEGVDVSQVTTEGTIGR